MEKCFGAVRELRISSLGFPVKSISPKSLDINIPDVTTAWWRTVSSKHVTLNVRHILPDISANDKRLSY